MSERKKEIGKERDKHGIKRKRETCLQSINCCNLLSGGSESLLLSVCSRVLRVIVEL